MTIFPYRCSMCDKEITDVQALFSLKEVGKILCYTHMKELQDAKKGKFN